MGNLVQRGRLIAKNPLCAGAIAVFLYFFWAGVDKYILDGQPMKDVLSWLFETALAALDKSPVQIALIALAIWMFARGIKNIEQAQDRAAQDTIDAEARETKIRETLSATILDTVQRENESHRGQINSLMDANTLRMEDLQKSALDALINTCASVMHPVAELMMEVANAKAARSALGRMLTEQSIDQRLSVYDPQMPALFDEHIYLVRQEFDSVKKSLPMRLEKATDTLDFDNDRISLKLESQTEIERGSKDYKEIFSLYRERAELAASVREALEKSEKRIEELSTQIRSAT